MRLNNALEGRNTPYMDAYLRNLHDFRVSAELSLLPILNFFIHQSENNDVFLLPSPVFEHERYYLEFLAQRYKKRPFDFETAEDDQEIYRVLARLIAKTRKYVGYCLNDLLDVLHEQADVIGDVQIHHNIAYATMKVKDKYFKKLPPNYADQFPKIEDTQRSYPQAPATAKKKYADAFQLYMHVLAQIKQHAIDFEILKLYDFLMEIDVTEIHSDALCEILPDITRIAQHEYAKHAVEITVKPSRETKGAQRRFDAVLEEWASNVRRALEFRLLIAKDLMRYLNTHATQAQKFFVEQGCYAEITTLLEDTYEQLGVKPNA